MTRWLPFQAWGNCGSMGEVNQGGALLREGLRYQTGHPELVTL